MLPLHHMLRRYITTCLTNDPGREGTLEYFENKILVDIPESFSFSNLRDSVIKLRQLSGRPIKNRMTSRKYCSDIMGELHIRV
jgi:hypothetical protein